MNSNQTVVKLADIAYGALTKDTRLNGVEYWRLRENAPEWVRAFVDAIHNGSPHDDFTFQFILESVVAIVELDAATIFESGFDNVLLEADTDLGDLLRWLREKASRLEYVDVAYQNTVTNNYYEDRHTGRMYDDGYTPNAPTLFDMLQAGQLWELEEVYSNVLYYLRNVEV